MSTELTPDLELHRLVAALGNDDPNAGATLDLLIATYPGDARLHFMKGSVLAGSARLFEAHRSLSRAVELAPEFKLARYQLGFFELTSGEPQKAMTTWGPLLADGDDSCFRKFVEGMAHLIRDEFAAAFALFEAGMALNTDNELLNNDIRLLMAECTKLDGTSAESRKDGAEHSATSLMLSQFGLGSKTIQ
jgi:tetratricopeptide (TPR) repeat protein